MSSHSSARRQSARLSTSRAMGPTASCTVGQGGEEREITQPRGVPGLGPSKGWARALECEQTGGRNADLEWPGGPTLPPRRGRGRGADPPPPGRRGNHRPHLLPVHRHSPSGHSCWIRNTRGWKWEMATPCPTPHPVSSPQLSHHFGN